MKLSWAPGLPSGFKLLLEPFVKFCYFGCLKSASKSVQVLFSGMEVVMVLTLIILK